MANFVNQNNILQPTSKKGFQFIISFRLTLGLISAHCQHFLLVGGAFRSMTKHIEKFAQC